MAALPGGLVRAAHRAKPRGDRRLAGSRREGVGRGGRTPDLLARLVKGPIRRRFDHGGGAYFDYSLPTLERLTSLGVLECLVSGPESLDDPLEYSLDLGVQDVVQAVLEPGPWHSAVAALLDDERASVIPTEGPRASEVTIEQTRMIAHEVRNALVPVRHHLDALMGTPRMPRAKALPRVESAKRGVVRVLELVDDLVTTSELISEPSTLVDVRMAAVEAREWVDGVDRVELVTVRNAGVRAVRSRLVRALANLLRNALQATSSDRAVRVTVDVIEAQARVSVDDAGPGVPESDRDRVFDDGFTTRPGGSGFGLAFVRRVVETDLAGSVSCEPSDLGGARFVVTLPEAAET